MDDILQIDPESIQLHLPHYKMTTKSSCGAVAMRSLGAYYDFGPKTEAAWKKLLKTTTDFGTETKNIVRTLRDFGLTVWIRRNLELEGLIENLKQKHPVICAIQAWGNQRDYRKLESGHWVVAIGYDDKNIYFEDSCCKKTRGHMTKTKFLNRWQDVGSNQFLNQLGLIVKCPWEPKQEYHLFKSHLIS